ncbi:MAG: hypothetical protein AAF577_01635 [Pseudomonadota bacterium]
MLSAVATIAYPILAQVVDLEDWAIGVFLGGPAFAPIIGETILLGAVIIGGLLLLPWGRGSPSRCAGSPSAATRWRRPPTMDAVSKANS